MSGIIIGAGVVAVGGVVMAGMSKASADKAATAAQKNIDEQNRIARENLKFQREEAKKLEKQKDVYRSFEFTNPYENMENVYEDATIDTRQADFQKQSFQQSQANIMDSMQSAAGGSGIAGLAQAMAGQGQLASQQQSASIGQQERANQQRSLAESSRIDMLHRSGEAGIEEKEMNRQSTLLGMQMGQLTGANAAVQQSQQNQMSANASLANMHGQQAAGQMQAAGSMFSTAGQMAGSDRRLKKNISKIGQSPSGLNIYNFEYKNSKYGEGLFQGVMSNEIPQEAVVQMDNGYDAVDYSVLDVEFKQI
jgi:hypothetical protein|tara:strand:+ start:512 stop:1435 length:924 start_codon:yes stop_codon:yes gene_type:complete